MILPGLFLAFFEIGMFSFGGGYAMISLLQSEAVERNWMAIHEFVNIVAISQITPGPIAVNMATFVGFRQAGILGSLVATAGVCVPSFLIVTTAFRFIERFKRSRLLQDVFGGLRPAVAGLILAACVQIAWPEFFPDRAFSDFSGILYGIDFRSVALAVAAFAAVRFAKRSPMTVILASAAIGVVLFAFG